MASLRSLVKKFGLGITVDNDESFEYSSNPFKIVSEADGSRYNVEYLNNGHKCQVLKECKATNDYHLVSVQ